MNESQRKKGRGDCDNQLTTAVRIITSFIIDICIQMIRQATVQFLSILALTLPSLLRLQRPRIYIRNNLIDSIKMLAVVVAQRLFVKVLLRMIAVFPSGFCVFCVCRAANAVGY